MCCVFYSWWDSGFKLYLTSRTCRKSWIDLRTSGETRCKVWVNYFVVWGWCVLWDCKIYMICCVFSINKVMEVMLWIWWCIVEAIYCVVSVFGLTRVLSWWWDLKLCWCFFWINVLSVLFWDLVWVFSCIYIYNVFLWINETNLYYCYFNFFNLFCGVKMFVCGVLIWL